MHNCQQINQHVRFRIKRKLSFASTTPLFYARLPNWSTNYNNQICNAGKDPDDSPLPEPFDRAGQID